jgi:PKHD-type hydroxylase
MTSYNIAPPPDLSTKEINWAFWENGFSPEDLDCIIDVCEKFTPIVGEVNSGVVEAVRKSKVAWVPTTPETMFVFDKLAYIVRQLNGQFFGFDLHGFNEDLQFTVYGDDQDHYTWHIDKGNLNSAPRKLSIVLQLSNPEDYEGGDLQFNIGGSDIFTATKKRGLLYAFPSWVLHRVTPVTAGTRKTLVAWVSGPKFR